MHCWHRLCYLYRMQDAHDEPIAETIKKYRLERLWTLRQMATVIGLTTGALWKIENGKVKPHELTVAKIQRALPDIEINSAA